MKLKEKTERYSRGNRDFVGKYKKWNYNICYSTTSYISENPFWYFYCNKEDNRFNSLWEELRYNSKEECHDACVKYINEQEVK